jgi:N-glycosylase/DNA lyase|tara:strand:+ start:183 stop:356 length:174 start_codon:yes stop_codon:yes gene_type:complete
MTHDEIVSAYENYLAENASFETKNIKASAARARKALGNLAKLAKVRRAEIQERKVNM